MNSELRTLIADMRDAIEEAHDTHIYAENDEHPADCHYCELINQANKLIGDN